MESDTKTHSIGGCKRWMNKSVFDAAVERMQVLYEAGHRVVVSFSAGKDSGVCLEICIIAARAAGRLPVEVVMRDDEIMYPGTFEYAARVRERPEVSFHWLVARQPNVNIFNREKPYWWVFDPLLPPESWVRQPPPCAEFIKDQSEENMTTPARFPVPPGKELFAVIGLRTQESNRRRYSVHSAGGYLTQANSYGVRNCRPIYDWSDGDVWKAILENKWDYNRAYDSMFRLGIQRRALRIASPTINVVGIEQLAVASRAWPQWFAKVCERLPGVRTAAKFGRTVVTPHRNLGESWETVFQRECIDEAPAWIAERATAVRKRYLSMHSAHSTAPFPDIAGCIHCGGGASVGSWKNLAMILYTGDPFNLKIPENVIPSVEPEYFRPGAGQWGGRKLGW